MSKAKYLTYKPSKTLWQEQIPSHWQETELRILFADNKNKNIGLVERNLLSLSYGKLKRKDIDNATGLVPASFEGYQIIDEGYIVLRFTDLQNDKKSLRVGYANEKGIITNAYVGLAPKANIHSKYFYYQLHFLDKIKYFYNLGSGVRQSLAYKEFGRETVLIPEKDEQIAIANFLDFKLAKIDRFIRKKKQLIKLLNEKKAAIISQAVTKGLNPNAKLKLTGIEWLGNIPEHWQLNKLKYLCKITTGNKNTEDRIEDGDYDFFVRSQIIEKINSYSFDGEGILTAGDGVGVGKVFHYVNGKFDYHQRVYLFYDFPKTVYGKFLFYYLKILLKTELMLYNAKSTVDSVRLPVLKNFPVALPKYSEQKEIVAYIENEFQIIEKTVATIESEVSLTQEYKTALIAEAVTGKIDVRDFEIPETSEEETFEELEDELSITAEGETEYETEELE